MKNIKISILGAITCIVLSFSARAENNTVSSTDPEPLVFHENQYFIELDSLVPVTAINALLSDLNSREVWYDEDISLALWEVISFPFTTPGGEIITDINGVIGAAAKKTEIESSTFNIQQTLNTGHSSLETSCFSILDYFNVPGNESIMVSILDTGISPQISNSSTVDYNYNIHIESGFDYVNNDENPEDEHGHGTHIAGLIHSITHQASATNNPISFDIRKTHDSNGSAYMSNVVFALMDAIDEGADIINMSFSAQGLYHDTLFFPLKIIIEDALLDDGQLIIAAAGNQSIDNNNFLSTALPASFPNENIISVGSSSCENTLSLFSNYGSSAVDIAILGEGIPGPDLHSNELIYLSGTSQATAIVSALAALKATHQGDFDFRPIKCALLNSIDHFVDLADRNETDGIVNAQQMLAYDELCILVDQCENDFTASNGLFGNPIQNAIYETNQSIESVQMISSQVEISYDSFSSTVLLPGFEVALGANFLILSNGCQ